MQNQKRRFGKNFQFIVAISYGLINPLYIWLNKHEDSNI